MTMKTSISTIWTVITMSDLQISGPSMVLVDITRLHLRAGLAFGLPPCVKM